MEKLQKLRNHLIDQLTLHGRNEDKFVEELVGIVQREGDQTYPVLLNLLSQQDFSNEEAKEHWEAILEHRNQMSFDLVRPVSLIAALCDYFFSVRRLMINPKLVELEVYEETSLSSQSDYLTGLHNRASFDDALTRELNRAKRYKTEFSLVFLGLDDFKKLNDVHGHLAGDQALKDVARLIKREKRAADICARYGGEEIVMILPETNKVKAKIKAEMIRKNVENTDISFYGRQIKLTLSGGVASYPVDAKTELGLVHCADKALSRAKLSGKNRIALFSTDKRTCPRIDFKGPVKIQALGKCSANYFFCQSQDLSLSGSLLNSTQPMEVGCRVQIQFPIPSPESPISLIGQVVRQEPVNSHHNIGVNFIEMNVREQTELSQFFHKTSDYPAGGSPGFKPSENYY